MKNVVNTLLNLHFNKAVALVFAAIIGATVFFYYFDLTILNPKNLTWLVDGDRLQHYVGSYALRLDEWRFPITKTNLIAYPEGASIIYTDSNPLLSTFFKLFRPIFPPEYQFFGLWFLSCWILQAIFGYLIVMKLTKNSIYSLLCAGLLCLLPAMFHRVMHTNLTAFWIILWAIYVFISSDKKYIKKEILFFLIFSISTLTHGYFLFMTGFIAATWIIKRTFLHLKNKEVKELGFFCLRLFVLFGLFLAILWVFGLFYNTPEHNSQNGFGKYSMNILAPFDPHKRFSILLPPLNHMKMQFVEGFQYLGLGVISLYLIVSVLILKTTKKKDLIILTSTLLAFECFILFFFNSLPIYHNLILLASFAFIFMVVKLFRKEMKTPLISLVFPAFFCLILALSHQVYLGEVKILSYSIIEEGFGAEIFRIIRSSGRFFWVTNITLILISVYFIFNSLKSKQVALLLLATCAIIQITDLSRVKDYVSNQFPQKKINVMPEHFKEMIASAKKITFLSSGDLNISLEAVKNKIPINSFYMVHGFGKITAKKLNDQLRRIEKEEEKLNDSTLYFVRDIQRFHFPKNQGLRYYRYNSKLFALVTSGFNYTNPNLHPIRQKETTLNDVFNSIPHKKLVIIAVKDDASQRLPKFFSDKLDETYGSQLSKLKFRASYLAIFEKGKLTYEKMDSLNSVVFDQLIDGHSTLIKSAGGKGNTASIKIDGQEVSLNKRGLNIVSSDSLNSYSSFNFDTYSIEYKK